MSNSNTIKVGNSLVIQKKVEVEDTALHYGSGNLDNLLATPSLVALMIEASAKLVDKSLPEGFISAGKKFELSHDNPTVLGETVTVKAVVKEFDGRKVLLELIAYDEVGTIGTGLHERIIVNKKILLEKANNRAKALENKNY